MLTHITRHHLATEARDLTKVINCIHLFGAILIMDGYVRGGSAQLVGAGAG